MIPEKFLIKNEWTGSEEILSVHNPYTGELVKMTYRSSHEQINESLEYLSEVYKKYRILPAYKKSEILTNVSCSIKENREQLAQLITLETGKPIKFSRIEVDRAVLTFTLGSEEAKRIEGEVLDLALLPGSENKMGIIKRFPIGVIFGITPWNFPINLVAHKLAPALASGNVVLLKPASSSPCCAIELTKIIQRCCHDAGLDYTPLNIVTPAGKDLDKFICDDRVAMVSFTGSPEVGWGIRKKVNRQKVSLELGNNSAVIVDSTADINIAVNKIITAGFGSAGQSCISVQRVYIHKDVYESFEKHLLEETNKIKTGDPFDEDTLTASMIDEGEAKRIEEWINEAAGSGAVVLSGGTRNNAVLQPTIISKASESMNVNKKEVFAPLITIKKINDLDEGLALANDTEYGLQAGVFTNDMKNAFKAFEVLEMGGVIINDVSTYRMDSMPYGGVKLSGNAREGIKYAIEEMTERKIMVVSG
ncbi:aldehyde dehydrogenase family protein [soil metagenome]